VDNEGNVYVADTGNHRIQKFDANGVYITQWGTQGSGNGQFSYPRCIDINSQGDVYVSDNNGVQKMN
jgi:tripartite motif-containing protein 71